MPGLIHGMKNDETYFIPVPKVEMVLVQSGGLGANVGLVVEGETHWFSSNHHGVDVAKVFPRFFRASHGKTTWLYDIESNKFWEV